MLSERMSLEVAEHVLQRFEKLHGEAPESYRVVPCRGRFATTDRTFVDMGRVWDDIHMRNGRMILSNPAFKLKQWVAAATWLGERWPAHRNLTVPTSLADRIDVDRLSFFPLPARRRPRRKSS